jgi:trehalose/maltose hydrolase-like predicted phosphorylase
MERLFTPTDDPNWTLGESRVDTWREPSTGSRLAVGNGLMAMRGAPDVARPPGWASWITTFRPVSWPRTYIAGLYDRPDIEPSVPLLMPVADWLHLRVRLDGRPLRLDPTTARQYRRVLDFKRGVLLTDWRVDDAQGLRVRTLRLAARHDPAIGLHLVQFSLPHDGIEVEIDASLDLFGVGLVPQALGAAFCQWRSERDHRLALATSATLDIAGHAVPPSGEGPLGWTWRWRSQAGRPAHFLRLVAVARSDAPADDPAPVARRALEAAVLGGPHGVCAAHHAALDARWAGSDVTVQGDHAAQRALRFAVHHLLASANPADEHVSIGARGLTGDGYLGHVFWDTEIHLLPFYTLTWPEAARALLMYRWHTLPRARQNAAAHGCRGAMFAWESADTGEEATPEHMLSAEGKRMAVTTGRQEHHITADIAYAVWQYWQVTGDVGFLRGPGLDLLMETARFWMGRSVLESDGRRHIRGVIGPDEYHEGVDDNAFTNLLARHNLRIAAEACDLVCERFGRADVAADEPAAWRAAAAAMFDGRDGEVFEQFSGFFARYGIDAAEVSHDVLGWLHRLEEPPKRVIKQADVVALLALLPGEVSWVGQRDNFALYEPLCTHASSLSAALHAIVASRVGEAKLALHHFHDAASRDLSADPAAAAWGVHIAALGGLWQAAVLGFGGLSWQGDVLHLAPRLPDGWRSLAFAVRWRGSLVRVRADDAGGIEVRLEDGAAVTVAVGGQTHALTSRAALSLRV